MKQFGNAAFRRGALATSSASVTNGGFVVLANLPPIDGKSVIHAAKLTAILAKSGKHVVTLSESPPSYALTRLDFMTRKRFNLTRARSQATIGADSRLVVYTSALHSKAPARQSLRRRFLQNRRRILFYVSSALRARSTTIVLDVWNPLKPSFWLGLMLIAVLSSRARRLRIETLHTPPESMCARLGVAGPGGISLSEAIDEVFSLNRHQGSYGRLDPIWLETAIESCRRNNVDDRVIRDLEGIAFLCRSIGPGGVLALRAFGGAGANEPVHPSPSAKYRFATSPPPADMVPRIVSHLRQILPAKLHIPRRALCNDANFHFWYIHSLPARNHIPPLPLPPTCVDKIARNLEGNSPETLDVLLSLARRGETLAALPAPVKAFFRAPVGGQSGNLSRLELICAVLAGAEISARDVGETPWKSETLRDWFRTSLCTKLPALSLFSTSTVPRPRTRTFGVAITGVITGHSGLAHNAEMHAQSLRRIGLEPGMVSVSPDTQASLRLPFHNTRKLRRSLVLHNANAPSIPLQVLSREVAQGADPVHVGFLLWELRQVPRSHLLAGNILDDIWVPSRFVQEIYQNAFDRQVFNIGKSIQLPDVKPADLTELGIKPEHKLFLLVFDAHSMVERKNPLAGVQAFLKAFPEDPDARLLVKTTPMPKSGIGDPYGQMAGIFRLAEQDPRIVIEQTILPFRDLLARIRRADCIISPHRAEGFGYIPAYALYYGRPVIVTDYSGTREFCTPETAFPVPYRLSEVGAGAFIDDIPDAVWADIDTDALADTIRHVASSPDEAAIKAKAGQNLVRERFSPDQYAGRMLERLVALGIVDA